MEDARRRRPRRAPAHAARRGRRGRARPARGRYKGIEGFQVLLLELEAVLPRPAEPPKQEEPPAPAEEPAVKKKKLPPRISREEIYDQIDKGVKVDRVYVGMTVLAALIAAFGLIKDDIAVIIGAMVIAPLLMPNVAAALASTLGDKDLARKALRANAVGIGLALAIAFAVGLCTPGTELFDARGGLLSPSLLARTDLRPGVIVLALLSGVAGTLAVTAGLSGTVIGVMVAVALMPPLVTFGMLLGAGQIQLALRALELLAANVISVNLAGVATFLFMGVRPRTWFEAEQARHAIRRAITLWAVLLTGLTLLVVSRL
ncbi:MAG: TIGR00341 family protein [Planctomycetota bacterium]